MTKKRISSDIKFWAGKFPGVDSGATKTSNLEEIHRNDWVDDLGQDDFDQLMIIMNPCGITTDIYGRRVKPDGRWKACLRPKR